MTETPPSPLRELQRLGQSPWLDNITRGMLGLGSLARLVRNGDVTGLTSNPTIFEQAISTLNDSARRNLIRKADSRIWAAAGSIPLYQRPQLTAARKNLANTGAFGFRTPVYEDMGFLKKGARPAPGATASKK